MSPVQGNDPVMSVYVISNGFLLEVHRGAEDVSLFTYAKDEIGIAEEIIAAQARHKLDIEPKQGEMFTQKEMGKGRKSND
jgi:hypothetical protein